MPFDFKDRVPTKLGRVKITPENGGTPYYAVVERADEPSVAGTPLSAANLNAAQETLIYTGASTNSTWKRIYIDPNGNDNNAGTAAAPMKTISGAIHKWAKWHKYMDIFLNDGTYTENIGQVATDQCNLSIRSTSENVDAVTLNMSEEFGCHLNITRMYNITINVTAADVRPVSVNGGTFYAYNVRFNVPTTSNSSCINVYNGCCAFLTNCILNGSTSNAAGVYGNQALLIRAYNCTSERKLYRAFFATNGSTIEYTPTVTATNMTHETAGGKCINLTARPGSVSGTMASISGQYKTFDGLLLQWGSIDITPTATNTPTTKRVTFPIKYAQIPLVFTQAITSAPDTCSIAVMRSTVSDQTAAADIILTRTNTVNTVISWFAIGPT